MHPNAQLIQRFYAAFETLDGEAMQACYAPEARFADPVFELRGAREIGAMWRMLCDATRSRGRDGWALEASGIEADDLHGRAHWEPRYRFGPRGRPVHNVIDAEFTFRDGLIASHVDRFDFARWARQALGPAGWVLGGTPWLRRRVRGQAARSLARWQHEHGGA